MLRIWGRKNSSNVRKALWIAEELGLAYESINAGGAFGINDQPEYLAKNPNGVVPMIEDGDFVLWESNAIVRYLAAQYAPDSALFPSDPKARAQADKWMDWTTSTLAGPFRSVFWGVVRTPADQRDWAQINVAKVTIDAKQPAEVYIGGQYVAEAPVTRELPPGRYAVALIANDGRRRSFQVEVEAGERLRKVWDFDRMEWR